MKRILSAALLSLLTCAALANTCPTLQAGSTSQSVNVTFIDNTTGLPVSGLAFNTSGIDINYTRSKNAQTAVTEATQTVNGAYSSGGFVSNGQGTYRFDIPDAAIAAGVPYVYVSGVMTGYTMLPCVIDLSPPVNAVAIAGTATAVPGASGGVLISGSNAGTTTLGALTVTGATTHTGNVAMAAGLNITQSTSNTAALVVTGNGTGNGATITSGSGATGTGLAVVSAATNGSAATFAGVGTGSGVSSTGGATGHGLLTIGGATSGDGLRATATTSGKGINAIGVGTTQAGILATGGSTSSPGLSAAGGGTGAGLLATGGATGIGLSLVGGATSGNAIGASYTAPIGPVREFGIDESGTLQSATGTTAVLRSATSFADNFLVGKTLQITGGTGVGQSRSITAWVNSTDTATVATWDTTPDNTSTYEIIGTATSSGGGSGLDAAATRAALGMSSANLDTQLAAIDDYVDTEIAAIKTKTDFLPSATAGAAGGLFIAGTNAATTITTALTTTFTGNLTGSVASVTGAVGSVTGNVGGNVTGSVGSVATGGITAASIATDAIGAAELAADAVTEIQSGLATSSALTTVSGKVDAVDDYVDTEVAAIKAKTDQLNFGVAGQVDANTESMNAAPIIGTGQSNDQWRGQ